MKVRSSKGQNIDWKPNTSKIKRMVSVSESGKKNDDVGFGIELNFLKLQGGFFSDFMNEVISMCEKARTY